MPRMLKTSLLLPALLCMFSLCKKPAVGLHTPSTPCRPSGASEGITDTAYAFHTYSTDPDGDLISYRVFVTSGDTTGWKQWKASGDTFRFTVTFFVADTYAITVQARDIKDSISDWSEPHLIAISEPAPPPNRPPRTPGKPIGFSHASAGIPHWVASEVFDPDGDSVWVRIDLGNGDTTDWGRAVRSDDYAFNYVTFPATGSYSLRAQAKDNSGALSGLSDTTNVTVETSDFPDRLLHQVRTGAAHSLAMLPDGSRLYTLGERGILSAVRTSDDSIIAQLQLSRIGEEGSFLAARPDGQYVYVSAFNSYYVWVVRTTDNTLTDSIRVGAYPMGIATTTDGRYLYVACADSGHVYVVRTADNAVIDTIRCRAYAYSMKPSPDGQYMYVANTGSRSIMSIRTNDNTVAATRGLGSSPFDITVLPSGEFIYVACWDSGMVAVVRASDFTVVAKAHLFSYAWGIAAMPDGHHVYVGNNLFDFEGTAVIRTSDNQVVADVSTDGEAHGGIVPLPNGSKVYVGSGQFGSSVSVIGRQLLAAPLSGVSAPRRLEASPVTRGRPRPPLSAVFGSRQTAGSTHGERGKSRTPASKPRIGD